MLCRLDELASYNYYFQYTLNSNGTDTEKSVSHGGTILCLPMKNTPSSFIGRILPASPKRSKIIRKDACWTLQAITSIFARGRRPKHRSAARRRDQAHAVTFKEAADRFAIRLNTCTVKVDLHDLGIPDGQCVGKELIERIAGYPIAANGADPALHVALCERCYKGFFIQFRRILQSTAQTFTAKDYTINTIGRHVKELKIIMRAAREEGLHNNGLIESRKFRVLTADVENIYLTESEIRAIADLDLSGDKHKDICPRHFSGRLLYCAAV